MITLLKANIEIFLTIAFGLSASWLALWGLSMQKRALPRKAFGIGGVARVIFTSPAERTAEFEVRFRGDIVTRLTENHAFFMNTGNIEITAEDFHHPAAIVIEGTEHIYDCQVIAQRPADLKAEVVTTTIDGEAKITLTPLLMNPGDFIAVRFIRGGSAGRTRSRTGRIKGVPSIDLLLPGDYSQWFTIYPLVLGAISLLFFAFSGAVYYRVIPNPPPNTSYTALIPAIIGSMFLIGALRHRVTWRDLRKASYMGKGTEFLEFQPLIGEK